MFSSGTKIFSKISDAARLALNNQKNLEITNFIGSGPSIRARARLVVAAAFLVSTPTLFIGVMKTEDVARHASLLSQYDDYWKQILSTKIAMKDLDLAIWSYVNEQEFENAQATQIASERLTKTVSKLIGSKPEDLEVGPEGFLVGLTTRLDSSIKKSIANNTSLAPARLSIITLAKELGVVEDRVIQRAREERNYAFSALSTVGRDQLILFLILLFSIPIFVGFMPGWIVLPLGRLKQMSAKIEAGKIKELGIVGKDEVAVLARTLKEYLLKKEDLAQKKSSKIFEMRNILRQTINKISQPVLVIDESLKINYTNEAMSEISGLATHQLEGSSLNDVIFSSDLKKMIVKSFDGHLYEDDEEIKIEVFDGRLYDIFANIGIVRNRDGEISRAVIVFFDKKGKS